MSPSTQFAIRWTIRSVAIGVSLTLVSCNVTIRPGGGGGGDNETMVTVSLDEFTVTLDRDSAPAGSVTFDVTNVGDELHEFVVIRTDLDPEDLPTEDDGSYEENGPGTDLLAEIEPFAPGTTESLTLDLEAGNYVLICNLVEVIDGDTEAHYARGMRAGFTVE